MEDECNYEGKKAVKKRSARGGGGGQNSVQLGKVTELSNVNQGVEEESAGPSKRCGNRSGLQNWRQRTAEEKEGKEEEKEREKKKKPEAARKAPFSTIEKQKTKKNKKKNRNAKPGKYLETLGQRKETIKRRGFTEKIKGK